MTARWLRSKSSGGMRVSPYLTRAVEFADGNADVIVAFDFDNVMGTDEISRRLKEVKGVDKDNLQLFANELSNLDGITLGVTVREKISGSIKIDFKQSPIGMRSAGKQVLIHALKKNGLMIDDIENWSVTFRGNQVTISGELSESGFRQLGMLIRQPILEDFVYAGGEGPDVSTATKSKQYFNDIEHVFEELRRKELGQLSSYAKWFDRYAREIDGLSIRGVDEVLVEHGRYVADSFRDIAAGLRGNDLSRAGNVASQGDNFYAVDRHGRYGSYSTNYNRRNRRVASSLGTMSGANQAKEIFGEVDSATAKIRGEMSKKYDIDF